MPAGLATTTCLAQTTKRPSNASALDGDSIARCFSQRIRFERFRQCRHSGCHNTAHQRT
ncbi:MAG: hypothetical protein FWD53_08595 [Phycisphaerales bacterium]|nr:hypothetical protein [Phycisphaerales bacterium]